MERKIKILSLVLLFVFLCPIFVQADVNVGENDILTLTWQANPETDIKHYNVYWCHTVDGEYIFLTSIVETQHIPIGLEEGEYFFKLSAVDNVDNKSELSVASEKAILDKSSPSIPGQISLTVTVVD